MANTISEEKVINRLPTPLMQYPFQGKKMIKSEKNQFSKDSSNNKMIDERLQDRLLWQDTCNKAIKKRLLSHGLQTQLSEQLQQLQ